MPCHAVLPQVKLDGPVCDYEGAMEAKRRLSRQIFDTVGHKSLDTPAYQVGSYTGDVCAAVDALVSTLACFIQAFKAHVLITPGDCKP